MSKTDSRILLIVDAIFLFVWLLGPFKNLTPLQMGLGIGLAVVLNLAFISKRSRIGLLEPQKPLSTIATGMRQSMASPPVRDDSANPGFTLLRVLAGFLSIATFGQLIFTVLDVRQGNTHDALRSLARVLVGSFIIFWVLRVTRKSPNPS